MTQPRFLVPLLVSLTAAGVVHAQARAPLTPVAPANPTPVPAATGAGQPLPGPAAPDAPTPGVGTPPLPGATGSASDSVQGVQLPDVKDPMLDPVPDAPNQLASWQDALKLVRTQATALKISQARIVQAVGQSQQALAQALPKLTASGNYSRNITSLTPAAQAKADANPTFFFRDSLTAQLGLDIPILNVAAWYNIKTAHVRENAADLSAKDQERLLLTTVALGAVNVITASRVAESSRVSLAAALSLLDLTKRRFALGAATAVDVLRAEQEVSASRAAIVTADEALRQSREALGQSLGDSVAWGVGEAVRIEDLEATASSICKPIESLDVRSDIKAAQRSLDAAKRDTTSVDYTFLPTLDLTANAQWNRDEERTFSGRAINYNIGAVANWNLYDGGTRYGQKKIFKGSETVADQTLVQTKRDATIQISQADRSVLVAQTNLEVATRTRDLAKENARLTRLAFMNGSGTSFDLVQQAQALREAEIDLLVKDFGLVQAKLQSYLAKANCQI
jgi:multidrug efflux system outer membrane protein